jgi:hypothetical protein
MQGLDGLWLTGHSRMRWLTRTVGGALGHSVLFRAAQLYMTCMPRQVQALPVPPASVQSLEALALYCALVPPPG